MENYEKEKRIGKGTFGEAWLVHSKRSGRRYVIKEVCLEDMTEEDVGKTRTEATILGRCKHNNIIRYKEVFVLPNPETMCIVMEYADGGDLSGVLKAARSKGVTFEEARILFWFIQITFAVQYLHSNNILHRDLKTQNIFLTKSNLVKVGDFGIARFLRNKQDLATTAIGTPYYLSPEIWNRRPYNHKSDMWAVGCVLYEMCSLRHPFEADDFDSLMLRIMRGSYKPLPTHWSSLLRDLVSVLLRTTPERRPSADQVLLIPALKRLVVEYLKVHQTLIDSANATGNGSRRHQSSGDECRDSEHRRCQSHCGQKSLIPLKVRYIKQDFPDLPSSGVARGRSASDSVLERSQPSSKTPQHKTSPMVSPSSCRRKSKCPEEVSNFPNEERDPQNQPYVRTPEKLPVACCSSPASGGVSPGTPKPMKVFDLGKTFTAECPDLPRSLTMNSVISSSPHNLVSEI